MKKSDLRTGMRVTTRGGIVYTVLLNFCHEYDNIKEVLVSPYKNNWERLNLYNEDLTSKANTSFDIIKVEKPEHAYAIFQQTFKYITIWERQEPKEMTLEEIEKLLGYPIKIKEEKILW